MARALVLLLLVMTLGVSVGCYHAITPAERRASFQPYAQARIGSAVASDFLLRRTALLVNEGGGVGSATAVDARGYFLTAAHCVGKDSVRLVLLRDTRRSAVVPARVVWRGDVDQGGPDLALLRTAGPIPFAFEWAPRVMEGQPVLVCGPDYEEGVERSYLMDCIAGRVTAVGRSARSGEPIEEFRHDAPVHQGDSGGPVVALDGRLIGINYATVRLVLLPPLSVRVGVNASRPALGWLQAMIDEDDVRFRDVARRHDAQGPSSGAGEGDAVQPD